MGQDSEYMSLYKNTFNLLGKKFKLGSQNLQNGVDCFTLIINYLRNRGFNIPSTETFDGFTFENYGSAYLEDKKKLMQVAIKYLGTKTKKVDASGVTAGDILLIESFNGNRSFGIDTGNGFAISISETDGVVSVSKNDFKILGAFRCLV